MKFLGSFKNPSKVHKPKLMGLDFFKYIGPGLLVTVGFIDPGNWATNVAAGAQYGYSLLFVITLSTFMLIILQHNSAHLGIVTGYCLSETCRIFLKPWLGRLILYSAILAAVSTAFAEILGGAIALQMLVGLPLRIGGILVLLFVMWMLFTNSYKRLEKWIISFVSIVGISFIIELSMVHVEWGRAALSAVTPALPKGSIITIMSVLGAVVMPHNLYLHSEIIQSRQWNLKDEQVIESQLRYEFVDTSFSMMVGWAINSAMILVAAAIFFTKGIQITELNQAQQMLKPLLGSFASIIFAVALLMTGLSSSVTAGMAGGSIYAGLYKEPYDIHDSHTKIGVAITIILATITIFFIKNPFNGLIYSQMLLSIQLPITVFSQIYLTSSKKIMGKYANAGIERILLWAVAVIVAVLNIMLLLNM